MTGICAASSFRIGVLRGLSGPHGKVQQRAEQSVESLQGFLLEVKAAAIVSRLTAERAVRLAPSLRNPPA